MISYQLGGTNGDCHLLSKDQFLEPKIRKHVLLVSLRYLVGYDIDTNMMGPLAIALFSGIMLG